MSERPALPRTPEPLREGVRRRLAADIARRTAGRHAALLAEWALRDAGELPTRDDARADVEAELEILCRALGPLGAVDPDEVLPRGVYGD